MAFIKSLVGNSNANHFTGGGTCYTVQSNSGIYYQVYTDINNDVVYRKSRDGGNVWDAAVLIFAGTAPALSVWYDRWSGISGDLIHCAYNNSAIGDTLYRSIDASTSANTLSAQTTIFAGTSTATGGALSICRARGGNLYCKSMIDAGVEGGFFRSVDVGANWTSRTDSEALATTDQWILMPGWNAGDTQDMMMFFWDASADEISRCLYDDSGNSWAETSISGSMVDQIATANFPHFAGAVDILNSRNLLVAWSAVDLANADLRCWHVTESAITEVTNVVLNSGDDQGLCAIGIDTSTDNWYVFYGGASDGSQTFSTAIAIYYKMSSDHGTTWGAETIITPDVGTAAVNTAQINSIWCTPRFATRWMAFQWSITIIAITEESVRNKITMAARGSPY